MKVRMHAVAALVATALLAGGCGFASNSDKGDNGAGAKNGPIKVGYIGPLTGEFAGFGKSHLESLELAVDQWNAKGGVLGRKLTVVKGDSQGDAKQAATLARRFVDEGVKVVMGPTLTDEAQTAVPIFCQNGITAVTGLADLLHPSGDPCYFRTSLREDNAARFGARVLTDFLHAKAVAVIDNGASDTVATAKYAKEALAGKAEVKFSGSITPGKQDYSSTLTKVKGVHPDAIFLATTNPESAILRKQGENLGIQAKWLLAAGSVNPQFKKIAGARGVPSTSYDAARDTARFDEFAKAYKQKFGAEPANYNEYAYDASEILFAGIKKAGSLDPAKLQAAIRATRQYPGTTGPLSFDKTGGRGTELYQIEEYGSDQEWKTVENPPFDTP
jgi:branched-chain amino acid transport system substrate-binding protein